MRSLTKRITPYIISALCIAYVLWDINFKSLAESFRTLHLWPLFLSQILVLTAYIPMIARIRSLSSGKLSYTKCMHASFICIAANTLLPARLGEGAKTIIISRNATLSFKQALGIVFWERFADINALLVLGLFATIQLNSQLALLPLLAVVIIIWTILFLLVLWPQLVKRLTSYLPWEDVKTFCRDLALVLTEKLRFKDMAPLSTYTLILWTLGYISFFLVISFGTNLELNSGEILIVFVASIVGLTIPSAPAGIGVYESFVVGALLLYGVPKEEGLAIAIVLHLLQMLIPTLIGLCFISQLSDSSLDLFKKLKNSKTT